MNTFIFDELYTRHYAEIFRFCCRIIGDREDAKELTSETFVKAYFHYDPSQKTSFRTYIYRIAKNICIDFQRSRVYKQKKRTDNISETFFPHSPTSKRDQLEQDEEMTALYDCIDKLKNEEKIAVRLYHIEEFTLQGIAEILAKSINTVKNRIKAALANLQKCLQRKGIEL